MPEILAGAPGKRMRVRSLPSNSVLKTAIQQREYAAMAKET